MMSNADFAELKADIKEHGLSDPILRKDGHILDGRHRYPACQELGIKPTIVEYDVDGDIIDVIYSRNLFRRHLTDDQRAMLVAKRHGKQRQAEAKDRQTAHLRKGKQIPVGSKSNQRRRTREELAEEARVSPYKADAALRALNTEDPEFMEDVISGKKRLKEAKSKSDKSKRRKPKEPSFHDKVRDKFDRWMKSRWPMDQNKAVRWELFVQLLSRYEHGDPIRVTFADETVLETKELFHR